MSNLQDVTRTNKQQQAATATARETPHQPIWSTAELTLTASSNDSRQQLVLQRHGPDCGGSIKKTTPHVKTGIYICWGLFGESLPASFGCSGVRCVYALAV
jgi:hypothetical protein